MYPFEEEEEYEFAPIVCLVCRPVGVSVGPIAEQNCPDDKQTLLFK